MNEKRKSLIGSKNMAAELLIQGHREQAGHKKNLDGYVNNNSHPLIIGYGRRCCLKEVSKSVTDSIYRFAFQS